MSRETGYLAATLDKHKRLEQTRPPRIILIGSSSFAFGVRSDRLERESGRTVVNMGIDGSLGLDFILQEVRGAVRKGDCVVLSLESVLFSGGIKQLKQRQILEYRPASLAYVDPEVRRKLLDEHAWALPASWARRSLHLRFPKLLPKRSGSTYSRADFNRWGDYVAHYRDTNNLSLKARTQWDSVDGLVGGEGWGPTRAVRAGLRDRLEAFARLCTERGATFVFTCPPQPPEYLEQHRAFVRYAMEFLKSIHGLVILDSPEDHVYDLSMFYDTKAHLTKAGADLRTAKLVQELRMVLSRESGQLDSKGP